MLLLMICLETVLNTTPVLLGGCLLAASLLSLVSFPVLGGGWVFFLPWGGGLDLLPPYPPLCLPEYLWLPEGRPLLSW